MKVLVTGGLGYIGSHTVVELLNNNDEVIVVDNLSNSNIETKDKIKKITGKDFVFYEGDVIDEAFLNKVFDENKIDAVIDFAAFKAVGESSKKPIEYYTNNVSTVLVLLKVMKEHNVKRFVFSSSATVYGYREDGKPFKETDKIGMTFNPYGTSKYMVEMILQDLAKSDPDFSICILRYFNPIGAHESGLIGEDPKGIPANLMPYIVKVANRELDHLTVFGNDYNTPDGTGVRDYIHVVDLAIGHVKALEKLEKDKGIFVYNLGTGVGYSVLDIVNTFIKVNNVDVPYEIGPRRAGDVDSYYSDPTLAYEELDWHPTKTLEDMCKDSYNFVLKNK